jgi:hypothetical protein
MPNQSRRKAEIDFSTTVIDPLTQSSEASADTIRARAFEIYEARGGEPGQDLDDWLQAEGELRAVRDVVHV